MATSTFPGSTERGTTMPTARARADEPVAAAPTPTSAAAGEAQASRATTVPSERMRSERVGSTPTRWHSGTPAASPSGGNRGELPGVSRGGAAQKCGGPPPVRSERHGDGRRLSDVAGLVSRAHEDRVRAVRRPVGVPGHVERRCRAEVPRARRRRRAWSARRCPARSRSRARCPSHGFRWWAP